MNTETRKTLTYAAAAAALLLIAVVTAPRQVAPDAFFDQGETFFPEFTDPNTARTLEVIDFDVETGSAVPFKVTFSGGRWSIPSHHDYPADGADRLARTAAGLIGVTKDDFRTDNPADHAACGVVDPLDETNPNLQGRGQRITIKGENDVVLADLIVGKSFEGREHFRLVRVPGQKRVYGARITLDVSTAFKDWIEADLMLVDASEIEQTRLLDYSVDERTGRLNERGDIKLVRAGESDWEMEGLAEEEELERYKVNNLVRAVDELTIEGVRPKPEWLSATLTRADENARITDGDLLAMQSMGYYFTRDGRLVSNEGELQVRTKDGVTYTLRFGEVAFGTGLAVTAGGDAQQEGAPGENRYLMITASFDPTLFPEPPRPANRDFASRPDSVWTDADYENKNLQDAWDRWKRRVDAGNERSDALNRRFGPWYYVISAESFDKLRVKRADLVREKTT
ncbi:MAG: DUF4340 domain-containing protein [Candidatus Krumholzibacteria bacterium]|nr:DUF4340 domain-containing protein [Candidatus Krumholzibacteria bacterium]